MLSAVTACLFYILIISFTCIPFQNSSSLHCFAFADADFLPKTDVVTGPAPAGAKGAGLTIHTLSLKGRQDLVSPSFIAHNDVLRHSCQKMHFTPAYKVLVCCILVFSFFLQSLMCVQHRL